MDSLEKALDIINGEVIKLAKLAECADPLERGHAAMLNDYVKTLVSVRKDEREQARGEDLAARSDEELDELAKEALKYLQAQEEIK